MRRFIPLFISGALIAAAVSCRDSIVQPAAPQDTQVVEGGSAALAAVRQGARSVDFTIDPNGSHVSLFGLYEIKFPANSVCELGSTYGPGHWDDPCTTISAPLTIHATLQVSNGRLWVDFSPSIRFAPTSDPSQYVTLSTRLFSGFLLTHGKSYYSQNHPAMRTIGILFAPAIGAAPVDEAGLTGDPSLQTIINFKTGQIWRRIKHFTGYNISTGEECTPSPDDPYCVDSGVTDSSIVP